MSATERRRRPKGAGAAGFGLLSGSGTGATIGERADRPELVRESKRPPQVKISPDEFGDGTATVILGRREVDRIAPAPQPAPPLPSREGRAESTLSALDEGIVRTDDLGRVEYMNAAAMALLGCGLDLLGQPLAPHLRLIDEATREPLPDPLRRALEERRRIQTSDRATLVRTDRGEIATLGSVTPLVDEHERLTGAVLVLRDVGHTRELEREMSYLARHDPLTGLINRRELERRLREALESAHSARREHALLYLDLDQFKLVNDTCGHLAGDEMLKQIAAVLLSRLRRSDSLARLGGDEFGFLLFDCSGDAARQIAEEFRALVRSFRFDWEGHCFEIGASIGLVPIHAGSGDMTELLRAADSACYVVKDRGGNAVHGFTPDDTAIGFRDGEMRWVQRLQRALAEGRLRLHYQMIEPLQGSGSLPLCELFVRLVDREGHTHNASSFISAAERFGLMADIDRWVVHRSFSAIAEAFRNRREAPAGEPPFGAPIGGFTINLSARSLSDAGLLEFIEHELERSGVDPERVCFEITETAAIGNLDRAMRLISSLREFGCRFVLDDFGRGLSSFAYLRDLKVDMLKIDGDFVRGLADDAIHRAMVASIHQVGQVMGLATIAEGVEDQPTLDALREIGLDYAQGFFLHRPEAVIHDR